MTIMRAGMLPAIVILLASTAALACPVVGSQASITLERSDSTTEINLKPPLTISDTRFRSGATVKATYYQGLIELDRVQRDLTLVVRPKTPLDSFFPIKPNSTFRFDSESGEDGKEMRRTTTELTVLGARRFAIGDCILNVWLIERRVPGLHNEMRLDLTYYYSSDFKFIVAREYPARNGRLDIVTYNRVSQKKD